MYLRIGACRIILSCPIHGSVSQGEAVITCYIGHYSLFRAKLDGLMIVAPPSVHPNGTKYEWEQAPDEYELVTSEDIDVEYVFNSVVASNYKDKSKPLTIPEEIPEGQRDNFMFKLACKYQAMGMSDSAMLAALQEENKNRCKPPLTDKEIQI